MFVEKNKMLDKLRNGEIAFGIELRSRSMLIAELIGLCGYDFIHIETEHNVYNDESIENTVRAAQLAGTVPLLRIPTHDEGRMMQVLDMGIQGLILPHVDTPEQARAIMDATKYPPIGNRGISFNSRAASFGIGSTKEEYFKTANANVAIIPMIESQEGVDKVEGILDACPDVIRIGRDDLSSSMRMSQDNPEFKKAVKRIIDCATERGIAVGTGASSPEHAHRLIDEGYRMITYKADMTILHSALESFLVDMKDVIK